MTWLLAILIPPPDQLGPFIYVTVEAGEVGVKHTKGLLQVLAPGTHTIKTQEGETFHGFISVQQQVSQSVS